MSNNQIRSPIMASRASQNYHRMKYYSAIKTGLKHMGDKSTYLDVPTHVIDSDMFIVFQGNSEDSEGK